GASFRTDPVPLSRGNARVKDARKLARRAFRDRARRFLADGPKAVEAALAVGAADEVFATVDATAQFADLRAAAAAAEVRWTLLEERSEERRVGKEGRR